MGTNICLPVAKYSHATGLRVNNTVPWTHLSSPHLFIIVKGTDKAVKDEKLTLRIVQGSDVLESLDVSAFVDSATTAKRTAQSQGIKLQMEQLPIFGITKDTIVAVRYTAREGQARRLQMRMHTQAECRQIVHAFESRGMDFMEQRPSTAQPGASRPPTSRPLMISSQAATPQPGSDQYQVPPQVPAHPFTLQPLEAGSLSQARPAQAVSQTATPLLEGSTDSRTFPPPRLFTRDEVAAPREVEPVRPSTAQIYRSHTAQPQTVPDTSHDRQTGSLAEGIASTTAAPTTTCMTVSDAPTPARPATVSSFPYPDTLEHEIPPRRELPFDRPDSRRSASDRPGSRPGSSLTLPPLPKPKVSLSSSSSFDMRPPLRPTSPARPKSSSPLKRSYADMSAPDPGCERPSTASPVKTLSPTKSPLPQAPAKKPGRMEELLDGRKASLQKSSAAKVPRTDSLADAPGEDDEAYASRDWSKTQAMTASKAPIARDSMSPIRQSSPTRQANTNSDPTVNAYAAVSAAADRNGSLRQYAEQSLQDRQAALDEFMVQNLENSDFVVLCKDVENCWKRIALGL